MNFLTFFISFNRISELRARLEAVEEKLKDYQTIIFQLAHVVDMCETQIDGLTSSKHRDGGMTNNTIYEIGQDFFNKYKEE